MHELTPTQEHVLTELRRRGADWTAEATERHWRKGRGYYLDNRNQAARGLRRLFNKGNREAERATKERLEHLRREIEAERISMAEIDELQSLAEHIAPDDVLLLEWAGVPE